MEMLDTEDKGETESSKGIAKFSRKGLGKISVAEDLGAIPKQRQRAGSHHDDDDECRYGHLFCEFRTLHP
jgi:hypothetical protein